MTEQSLQSIPLRKRIWGWWFFDWASQPYHTLLVTFIFGRFFAEAATQYYLGTGLEAEAAKAQAQANWSLGLTLAGLAIGICAPFLGALADISGRRLPWIIGFSVAYVLGAAGLWFMDPAGNNLWLMLLSFGIGFIGAEFALIFVNAQLPSLGGREEVGQVSGSGFAFGYLGGVLSLFIMLLLFVEQDNGKTLIGLDPILGLDASAKEGTRAVGPFVALWYALFMVPYFLWVREPRSMSRGRASLGRAVAMVLASVKALGARKSLRTYLVSSMLYRDALNGLYGFGGVYAGLVLEWSAIQVGIFGIIAAISAALFSWLGSVADKRFGPKPVISASIFVLALVCVVVVSMSRTQLFGMPLAEGSGLPDQIFFACGVLIGGFGGILQATSRTLMVRHTTPETATEAFGLYGLSGRATAFVAPALIGLMTTLTGSARLGITPVIALFALGLLLLLWVDGEGDQS